MAPEAVHAQLAKSVGESITQLDAALDRTRELLPTPSSLTRLAHLFGSQTLLAQLARGFAPAPHAIDAAALVTYLDERVFTEATYEGRGSYRLDPALVCPAGEPACDAALDLHLRVSTDATSVDTLVVDVRIGTDEPIHLTVAPDELTVAVDLDVLQRSAPLLSAAFGLPSLALSGAVSVIVRTDDARASLFGSIDRPITIRVGDELAVASSKVGIAVVAIAYHSDDLGEVDLDLGATTVTRRVDGNQLELDLAALTMQAAFLARDEREPLVLHHLGVGDRPAVFSIDGAFAQSVEINRDDGREVNVLFQLDDGTMFVDASPRLDLRFAVDHAVLGEPAPPFEVTRVQLDGTLHAPADDRFEVVDGAYSVTTSPASAGFAAVPGQCVTTIDAPLSWTVARCP